MSDVLAITEHRRGELRDESFEVISAGRELADDAGETCISRSSAAMSKPTRTR